MNRIDLYAAFISEQVYMDEVIGGSDKGYPYVKDEHLSYPNDVHFYDIHLPDNILSSRVDIQHQPIGQAATVGFTMPKGGYGISPEAKKTYTKEFNRHVNNGSDHYDAHSMAANKVGLLHGREDSRKADEAWHSGETDVRDSTTNTAHHAYHVMSTISKILHEHGKSNPHIKEYHFSSSGDHDSREKLYHAIAKRHGGTRRDYPFHEGMYYYSIPNPHHSGD